MNGQPQSVSQSELIERAQRGDEQALEALFNTYKRRVYCLCLRMTRDPGQAEDLSQDAFLQLFRRISTFRGEAAFSTWFHRLVVNVVLMYLRKKRVSQIPLDDRDGCRQEQPVRHEYGAEDPRAGGSDRAYQYRSGAKPAFAGLSDHLPSRRTRLRALRNC